MKLVNNTPVHAPAVVGVQRNYFGWLRGKREVCCVEAIFEEVLFLNRVPQHFKLMSFEYILHPCACSLIFSGFVTLENILRVGIVVTDCEIQRYIFERF